jgi:hypothetical protein
VERRGWAESPEERERIDASLRGLTGTTLAGVRYLEMPYDGTPQWDCGTFHSLDFGLEIDLGDGTTWSVTWDQAGHNEGLLVDAKPLEFRPDADIATWDVTEMWRRRFPGGFTDIGAAWTRHAYGPAYTGVRWEIKVDDGGESDLCLFTLVLAGAGDERAVVTFGGKGYDEPPRYMPFSHDVSVFFSTADAEAAGVILPA